MTKALTKSMDYTIIMCALLLIFAFSQKAHAESGQKPGSAPVVTMQVWNASSEQEQYAFLAGVVSMFELEKEWQGQKGLLPLSQSMIGSWGVGMDGMSLKNIRSTVNTYSMNNPNEGDRLVLEVLWREFVQPKLKGTVAADSTDTQRRVRNIVESQKERNSLTLY